MALHESVSQDWNWKKILSVVSWLQMMLMDHTKHTEKSVWNSDPSSTRYSRCSAAMPFSQNLNFLEFEPSNGCNSFNFWARFMKFWILKVLKSYPNHSFLWFFDLLSEKPSYLVKRVEKSSADDSHITAMWTQLWLWNLDVVKKRAHMLFKAHLLGTLFWFTAFTA